jgi:hypothetical protein
LAAGLVAEALGAQRLALHLFGPGEPSFLATTREARDFEALLRCHREPGGPGVNLTAEPTASAELSALQPPEVPAFRDEDATVRFARPLDHAGAVCGDDGAPRDRPRGSIRYYQSLLIAPSTHLPVRRDGERGRPSQLDLRALLRILVGLVHRCDLERARPRDPLADPIVGPETCVALLVWLDGHCRPAEADRRVATVIDGLPTVTEVEPYVVTGPSIRALADTIRDLIRARPARR